MSDTIATLLYQGALALCEGRHDDARGLLMQVLEQDDRNEMAWLWLSGAMTDPTDQQIALENVLELNPNNIAAKQGLILLREQSDVTVIPAQHKAGPRYVEPGTGPWVPPPSLGPDDVLELSCWQCDASLYSVAQFCFQCHAPVHSCNNCRYRPDQRCKELQGLTSTMAHMGQNNCPWWNPPEG